MLRKRLEDMPPWVAALIVLGLFALLSLLVPPHQPSDYASYTNTENESGNELSWGGMAEIAAAIFTGILALFAFIQVRDSRRSSERQLRAYVSAMTMKLSAVGETLTFHTFLKNHGQTPAYETTDSAGVGILPFPMPRRYRFNLIDDPADPVGKFVMYPGGEHKTTQTKVLSDAQKRLLRSGKFGVYVFGSVNYVDAFGDDQVTEYCSVLAEPFLFNDIARAQAEKEPGVSITAGFRFTPHNNYSSVKWPKKWWRKRREVV